MVCSIHGGIALSSCPCSASPIDLSTFGVEGGLSVGVADETAAHLVREWRALLPQEDGPLIAVLLASPTAPSSSVVASSLASAFFDAVATYSYANGHAALVYSPSRANPARTLVVNICNPASPASPPLVSVSTLASYLFDASAEAFAGSEQFGIFNRSYVAVSLTDCTWEQAHAISEYVGWLGRAADAALASFSLTPAHSAIGKIKGAVADVADPGNCAEWISGALVAADILPSRRALPRSIATDLIYHYPADRIKIVSFERATEARTHPINDGYLLDNVAPVHSWLALQGNVHHAHLDRLAHLVVRVPSGTNIAHVIRVPDDERQVHMYHAQGTSSFSSLVLRHEPVGSVVIPFLYALALCQLSSLIHSAIVGLVLIVGGAIVTRAKFAIDMFFLHLSMMMFIGVSKWTVLALVDLPSASANLLIAAVTTVLWRRIAYGFV